jgi:hypothetical protein
LGDFIINCASNNKLLSILLYYLRFMQLRLLCTTSCLFVYYDSAHDWLFLDWTGDLTLPAVQDACVAVAQCYLQRTYSRVLNSNIQVTESRAGVATWLGAEFLPYMTLTGVKQLAWIGAPSSLLGNDLVQTMRKRVPGLALNLFDSIEDAIDWLQQPYSMPLEYYLPSRQPATQARLAQGAQAILQEAQLIRQEVQHLKQKVGRKPMTSSRA